MATRKVLEFHDTDVYKKNKKKQKKKKHANALQLGT